MTDISSYIKPNREVLVRLGFDGRLIDTFTGFSKRPVSDETNRYTSIQAFDAMKKINDYRLPGGSLQTDRRTDLYIQDVLGEMGYTSADWSMDTGLQNIPLAWFAGNTAGYEIQKACEAEGGRFYIREDGKLIFENRQHYNTNDEHKHSIWAFNFNNIISFNYEYNEDNIINRCIVKISPRVQQSSGDIWTYGETPYIQAGETRIIWASLEDPASPITDPVSTTDFTANAAADGSGADRTADFTVTATKFAQAVKLEVENTHGSNNSYLTLLKIRGQSYEKQGETEIEEDDSDSRDDYGDRKLVIENKYMLDEDYAQSLAEDIVEQYKDPKHWIKIGIRAIPQLQLGDMVGIQNSNKNEYYLMRVARIRTTMDENGMNQELTCREITDDETADYFEIGASDIAGTDIIAP